MSAESRHGRTLPDGDHAGEYEVAEGRLLDAVTFALRVMSADSIRGTVAVALKEDARAEGPGLRGALARIAATTPKMNLGRERVDVPVLDMWEAQRVASRALRSVEPDEEVESCPCPQCGEIDRMEDTHDG